MLIMYRIAGTSIIPDLYSLPAADLYPHTIFNISKKIPTAKHPKQKIINTVLIIPNISFGSKVVAL